MMLGHRISHWRSRFGLGVPPSTGMREALQWLMLSRLGTLYTILGIVVMQRLLRSDVLSSGQLISAFLLLCAGFAFNTLNSAVLNRVSVGWWIAGCNLVFDAIVTSGWIILVGGPENLFALLYLVQILAAALTFYQKGALVSAVVSSLCFGWVLHSGRGEDSFFVLWGIYSAIFFTLGMVGGFLSEELLRTTVSLREKSREFEKLSKLHERIIADMPTGLLTVDEKMVVNFINPAGSLILGKLPHEVVGKDLGELEQGLLPFFEKIESEEVAEQENADTSLSATGPQSHRSFFVHSHSRKGERRLQQRVEIGRGERRRTLRGDVAQLEDGQKRGGRVLLFQDVTKLLHLEEKLRQSEKLAAVGQLAAGIAHEIRNPLAGMSASIEMLKSSLPPMENDDENRKLMDIAVREIDRLNGLISEFLDFVKPEKLVLKETDLVKLLSDLCLGIKVSKDFKDRVEVVENYTPGVRALAHEEKLKQVALNLMVNAGQSISKQGRIEVGCAVVDEQTVKFWVSDNGCGMTEKVKQHLYEPFFTTKDKGTGLGLATAYKLVEAHQGEIRVTSAIGTGTTFEVILQSA